MAGECWLRSTPFLVREKLGNNESDKEIMENQEDANIESTTEGNNGEDKAGGINLGRDEEI